VFQIPHLKKKKPGLVRVRPGPGSTHRVARVWPGCCHSRSFVKPGPVQPPGRPGPGSTRWAGPGLITVALRAWISSDPSDPTTIQKRLGLATLADHRSWVWLGSWTQYHCIVNIKNIIFCIRNIVIVIIINIVNIKNIIICVINNIIFIIINKKIYYQYGKKNIELI